MLLPALKLQPSGHEAHLQTQAMLPPVRFPAFFLMPPMFGTNYVCSFFMGDTLHPTSDTQTSQGSAQLPHFPGALIHLSPTSTPKQTPRPHLLHSPSLIWPSLRCHTPRCVSGFCLSTGLRGRNSGSLLVVPHSHCGGSYPVHTSARVPEQSPLHPHTDRGPAHSRHPLFLPSTS